MRAVVLRNGQLAVRETPDLVPTDGLAGMVYDPTRDIVLGHEFAGEVVAHGPDCSDAFPAGTRVTAMPIVVHPNG